MRKSSITRVRIILITALLTLALACIGFVSFAKAENTFTSLDDIEFTMDGYGLIVEGDGGFNGLDFTVSIPADEYEAMTSEVGEGKAYASIETGVIIAPAYYNDEVAINADSLFGADATYDWAEFNGSSYKYNGDKIRVINIYANDWVKSSGAYEYTGGIIDIREENETIAMYSVGYVKLVDAQGVESYKFTDSVEVSVLAAAVQEYDFLDAAQQAWVTENWFDGAFPIVEEGTLLANTNGAETYNVMSAVTQNPAIKEIMAGFNGADGLSAVMTDANENVIEIDLANPVIDVTDDMFHVWNIEISAGSLVLYQGAIDLYAGLASPVWTDFTDTSVIGAYYGNDQTKTYINVKTLTAEAVEFDGKQAFEITNIIGHSPVSPVPGEIFMNVVPIHSKEYYAQYEGKDVSFNYSFYYAIDPAFDGNGKYVVNQYSYYGASGRSTGGTKGTDAFFNKWYNVSIPLDTVLADWDNIVNLKDAQYGWGTGMTRGMLYALTSDFGSLGGFEGTGLKLYIAGFDVALDISKLAMQGGDILVKLDDVADKTALDLTAYMKKDDVDMISSVAAISGVTYEMKGYSIADTIAVTDLTKVDVSEAKEGAYVLTITASGMPLYTATFDLYTSTSPVVWAESMTAENVVLRKLAYSTGWVSTNAVLLEAGVDYEFVDTLTVGDKVYNNTYVKVTIKEECTIAFDLKALHTKTYYQEMSDLTKNFHIRGYFPSSISTNANYSYNNYGIHNPNSTWRISTAGNCYESIVISMDNYLIASDNNTASGKFYNWDGIYSDKTGTNTMVQFEIPAAKITADAPFVFYLGDVKIEEGGETLAKEPAEKTIDLSSETSYDLINLIPENQQAKYKAMAKAWIGKSYTCCGVKIAGNGVAFVLTINGTKHVVVAAEDGSTMLKLDDFVVNADGTVSDSVKVGDLLTEGANTVIIKGYAMPTTLTIGHSTSLIPESTITIVGPAAPVVE